MDPGRAPPRKDIHCMESRERMKLELRRRNSCVSRCSLAVATTRRIPRIDSIKKLPSSELRSRMDFANVVVNAGNEVAELALGEKTRRKFLKMAVDRETHVEEALRREADVEITGADV